MRNAIALLCTERCSFIPLCLPLLQVVAAIGCGAQDERFVLEDDLRREALMPSSFCKIFVKPVLY